MGDHLLPTEDIYQSADNLGVALVAPHNLDGDIVVAADHTEVAQRKNKHFLVVADWTKDTPPNVEHIPHSALADIWLLTAPLSC